MKGFKTSVIRWDKWFKLYLQLDKATNELDKATFAFDAAYADIKDLDERTVSHKVSKDHAYEIPLNP